MPPKSFIECLFYKNIFDPSSTQAHCTPHKKMMFRKKALPEFLNHEPHSLDPKLNKMAVGLGTHKLIRDDLFRPIQPNLEIWPRRDIRCTTRFRLSEAV